MNELIENLKASGQDHEFYPTTTEIINKIISDLKSDCYGRRPNCGSFLDIGAGNGKVLNAIRDHKNREGERDFGGVDFYAIEKAAMLRELLDKDIYIIGTDFYEQSLLDKNIDVTFCNPPYSEYETWTTKIIRESASKVLYLVIPKRWTESQEIKDAIKYRDAKYKTLGEYSFENAEDRSARAIVNLIKFELSEEKEDAFDRFFNEEFKDLDAKFKDEDKEDKPEEDEKENKFGHLVLGQNYVKSLVEMYHEELKNIRKNYEMVGKLDAALLKEFDVCPKKILHCLKERTRGLKNIYWNELIGRMKEITERLINKKRDELFRKLHENGNVDFTETNIYAVVIWILKNSSIYIDDQLIEVYEEMISKANCHNYKSNQKVFEYDGWRYNQEKPTHIFLDYRIIISRWGSLESSFSRGYRIGESAGNQIRDILTVAHNLGFKCDTADYRLYRYGDFSWIPGKPQEFRAIKDGKNEVLMEVKAHLNGNLHIRMNQKFALALNVEYGRLKGWIHSKSEATEELMDTNAAQYFKSNFTLLPPAFLMIEQKPEEPKKDCEQLDIFKAT